MNTTHLLQRKGNPLRTVENTKYLHQQQNELRFICFFMIVHVLTKRNVVEQVVHGDARAFRRGSGFNLVVYHLIAFVPNSTNQRRIIKFKRLLPTTHITLPFCYNHNMTHRANRSQSLTSEAKCLDCVQIVQFPKFACCISLTKNG